MRSHSNICNRGGKDWTTEKSSWNGAWTLNDTGWKTLANFVCRNHEENSIFSVLNDISFSSMCFLHFLRFANRVDKVWYMRRLVIRVCNKWPMIWKWLECVCIVWVGCYVYGWNPKDWLDLLFHRIQTVKSHWMLKYEVFYHENDSHRPGFSRDHRV